MPLAGHPPISDHRPPADPGDTTEQVLNEQGRRIMPGSPGLSPQCRICTGLLEGNGQAESTRDGKARGRRWSIQVRPYGFVVARADTRSAAVQAWVDPLRCQGRPYDRRVAKRLSGPRVTDSGPKRPYGSERPVPANGQRYALEYGPAPRRSTIRRRLEGQPTGQ